MFENQSNGTVSASEKVNKSKNYLEKIKNFKTLPPKEKRNLLIAGIVAIIVLVILIIIISSVGGGASNQTVSEASLAIAEQDYGYKLDLTDYEIKDHFTSDTEVPLTGKKLKEKVYYVILDANTANLITILKV